MDMNKTATICENCGNATQQIHGPHLCPDCYIGSLENHVIEVESELEKHKKYWTWYRESEKKAAEYLRYKIAFEVLLKEVQK